MAQTAQRILTALAGESLPDWDDVSRRFTQLELTAGHWLFRAGDVMPCVHFVRTGLVKHIYLTADGNEWIKNFSYENTFFASINALQPGGRATFACVAIETSHIERIDYDVLLELADRHIAWQRALRRGFELFGAKKERRELELLTLSASERYLAFLHDTPQLLSRLPQHELAKYLGITPVSLSRIRSRLNDKALLPR